MKQIIEVLRLKYAARLSHEKIARACGLSKGTVNNYVSATHALGLTWPLPDGVDEARLEALLFLTRQPSSRLVEPDYFQMHQALKRKGVTLQLLWAEYVALHGERGYRYSQYCNRYRQWRDRQKRSMRQVQGKTQATANTKRPSSICRHSGIPAFRHSGIPAGWQLEVVFMQ
ncbi:MAG: hypothetical protein WBP89_01105 [Sedimenticolaceae bacterium]